MCPGGFGGSQETIIFMGPSCFSKRLVGSDATNEKMIKRSQARNNIHVYYHLEE